MTRRWHDLPPPRRKSSSPPKNVSPKRRHSAGRSKQFSVFVDPQFRRKSPVKRHKTTPRHLFELLKSLDARVSEEDYYMEGRWDVEGLRDDLQKETLRRQDAR